MKKAISILLMASLLCSLAACGGSSTSAPEPTVEPTAEPTPEPVKRDFPEGDYEEVGEGTARVHTDSGSTEDGNIPYIYAEKDLLGTQIMFTASGFNGAALTYIYIDGVLNDRLQLSDSMGTLSIYQDWIANGVHTVEMVQYADDLDTTSEITLYRKMQYEIKVLD